MIFSPEIEQQFLATLLQHPNGYPEIADFITHNDFYDGKSKVNQTIFSVIRQILEKNETLDTTVVIERVKALGITFSENLSLFDYVHSLGLRKTSAAALKTVAKELKKISIRRDIYYAAEDVGKEMKRISPDRTYDDIIKAADTTFNKRINYFESGDDTPINLAKEMEATVEERGDNPIQDFGLKGPFPKLHDIYGSLLRAGNISVIVARSGVGKTALCMNFCTKVALAEGVPVLHFDNGEMSKEELIMRQTAALSHVPLHDIETGKWRSKGPETVRKVRETWDKVKGLQFYYYNVGGMEVETMLTILKRFYFSVIGRGNELVFSFDYIKPAKGQYGQSEWAQIGEMVDTFKTCISKDILHNSKPVISMITSVQSNRYGITNNRRSDDIIDDESIISLSDRIIQYCSHMFILRKKTIDELADEGELYGTHKLINLKPRHLGRDIAGALEPVLIDGKLKRNFINFNIKNFDIEECGDLRDIASFRQANIELAPSPKGKTPDTSSLLPDFDAL